jgi:hypothetical protein
MEGNGLRMVFIAPSAVKQAFTYCRAYLGANGAFSKVVNDYHLYIVSAYDADNHLIILAWGFGPSESNASWSWFMQQFARAYLYINNPPLDTLYPSRYVFVSDRSKGLENAVTQHLPLVHHAHCTQHMQDNVRRLKGGGGAAAAAIFQNLVHAQTPQGFDNFMRGLKVRFPLAADHINSIDHTRWATYLFPLP